MVGMRPGDSAEDIAKELEEQAAALWGRRRAQAIRSSLEQTAQQLWEVGRHLPERELEPGFYQLPLTLAVSPPSLRQAQGRL